MYARLEQPYRVHNVYAHMSWLNQYGGPHPPQIEALRADLAAGRVTAEQRPVDDIERLLNSPAYRLGRATLRLATPLDRARRLGRQWWARVIRLQRQRRAHPAS